MSKKNTPPKEQYVDARVVWADLVRPHVRTETARKKIAERAGVADSTMGSIMHVPERASSGAWQRLSQESNDMSPREWNDMIAAIREVVQNRAKLPRPRRDWLELAGEMSESECSYYTELIRVLRSLAPSPSPDKRRK